MIEYEEDPLGDLTLNRLLYQILIAIYLYVYSLHLACIKNGLHVDGWPITFIATASAAGRTKNVIYIVFGIIGTFVFHCFLIKKVRKARLYINTRLKIQEIMEHTISLSNLEYFKNKLTVGFHILVAIIDIFALIVQHNTIVHDEALLQCDARLQSSIIFQLEEIFQHDTILQQVFVHLLRKWIRGASMTFLSTTIATKIIETLVTKYRIPTENIRNFETSRIVNYILISIILIADIAIECDITVITIGIIVVGPLAMHHFKTPQTGNRNISPQIQATQANHTITANSSTTGRIYKMMSKPCGIAVIIKNENFKTPLEFRLGATKDANNLCRLFNYLGFDTHYYKNKTHTEM